MWPGTANGWLSPHFNFDLANTAHEVPVVDLVQAVGLSTDHLMLALLCAPCRAHSVSNYASMKKGTAHDVYTALDDGRGAVEV